MPPIIMKVKRPEPSQIPDPPEPLGRPVILRLRLLLLRQNLFDPLHLLLGRLLLVRAIAPPPCQRVCYPGPWKGNQTHRVPTRIDVCTRTTPIACTTVCACPTTCITSSHDPSTVVPAECIVHLSPLARRRRWTAATSRATEGVAVPI